MSYFKKLPPIVQNFCRHIGLLPEDQTAASSADPASSSTNTTMFIRASALVERMLVGLSQLRYQTSTRFGRDANELVEGFYSAVPRGSDVAKELSMRAFDSTASTDERKLAQQALFSMVYTSGDDNRERLKFAQHPLMIAWRLLENKGVNIADFDHSDSKIQNQAVSALFNILVDEEAYTPVWFSVEFAIPIVLRIDESLCYSMAADTLKNIRHIVSTLDSQIPEENARTIAESLADSYEICSTYASVRPSLIDPEIDGLTGMIEHGSNIQAEFAMNKLILPLVVRLSLDPNSIDDIGTRLLALANEVDEEYPYRTAAVLRVARDTGSRISQDAESQLSPSWHKLFYWASKMPSPE